MQNVVDFNVLCLRSDAQGCQKMEDAGVPFGVISMKFNFFASVSLSENLHFSKKNLMA